MSATDAGTPTERAWFENGEFWRVLEPVLFHADRWERADGEIESLLDLVPVAPGGSVLDLCCGPGRHSLALARRGFSVTGVDLHAPYLESARAAAATDGLEVEWVHADVRKYRATRAFDLAINLFTSFGYFADAADDARLLEHTHAALRPGGHLVLDLIGKENLANRFVARDWEVLDDGVMLLQERNANEDWSWLDTRWILVDDRAAEEREATTGEPPREHCPSGDGAPRMRPARLHEYRFGHRIYSASELGRVLADTGFEAVRWYGGLDGSRYEPGSRRLVAVASRGE